MKHAWEISLFLIYMGVFLIIVRENSTIGISVMWLFILKDWLNEAKQDRIERRKEKDGQRKR